MYSAILFSILSLFQAQTSVSMTQALPVNHTKTIVLDGITTKWTPIDNYLEFEVTAPTSGWVSIGFNDRDASVFSNVIIGGVGDGKPKVEEHYMVRSALDKTIENAGGKKIISDATVTEETGTTTLRFRIPKVADDIFHYDLIPGQKIWMTCAYSENDDFGFMTKVERRIEVTL